MEYVAVILKENSIANKDMQTPFFNISPSQPSREITRCIDEVHPVFPFPEPGLGRTPELPWQLDCFPESTNSP